jgi:hypothetical protein
MAQTAVALLCVGSLLAWDDVVVIRCDHPASPFAPPAPPIAVPRIETLGIEAVTPDLAEEGGKSGHHKAAAAEGTEHEHRATSAKGGAGQHQHGGASAASSTNRGGQQHQH